MQKDSGFTLIELLVVIAIMAGVLSIIGPLTIQQYEKTKAQLEWQYVITIIENSKKKAFLTGSQISMVADGTLLELGAENSSPQPIELEYVFFEKQLFFINTQGFISPLLIKASINGKRVEHEFHQWQ